MTGLGTALCSTGRTSGRTFVWSFPKVVELEEGLMAYHMEADGITLESLQRRIETTDLVPSRVSFLNRLHKNLNALKKQGLTNPADLPAKMKTPKRVGSLAQTTGIENDYLVLLRREINSYFLQFRGHDT